MNTEGSEKPKLPLKAVKALESESSSSGKMTLLDKNLDDYLSPKHDITPARFT